MTKTRRDTILLVEDEKATRQVLADELLQAGFDVLEARNGKIGLELAEKERPDLILLDILMPIMDGMAMMKTLRDSPWGKKVPVIILTNVSATDTIIDRIVKDEPSYYLVKSDWKIRDILKKIRETLA